MVCTPQFISKLLKAGKLRNSFTINSSLHYEAVQGTQQRTNSALISQIGIYILKALPLANHHIAECKHRSCLQRILLVTIEQQLQLCRRHLAITGKVVIDCRGEHNLHCRKGIGVVAIKGDYTILIVREG